jgi:hypothetical protein
MVLPLPLLQDTKITPPLKKPLSIKASKLPITVEIHILQRTTNQSFLGAYLTRMNLESLFIHAHIFARNKAPTTPACQLVAKSISSSYLVFTKNLAQYLSQTPDQLRAV